MALKNMGRSNPLGRNEETRSLGIAKDLARRIVRGEFQVGTKLPPERDLSVEYDTARNMIREALKRLESAGLIQIRRGSGVYVKGLEFASGVEIFDVLMTHEDGSPNGPFLRDVLEFRGQFMRTIVRLAAVRRSPEELSALVRLIDERRTSREDVDRQVEIAREIFRLVASSTHNQVYQLMFNTLERVSNELQPLVDMQAQSFDERQRTYERILDAFEQKDAVAAELAVVRYVEAVSRFFAVDETPTGLLSLSPEA